MTKRETQAREYAAESAGQRPAASVTLTPSERNAVRFFSLYGGPAHHARTLRQLLERLK
jgi:hypothetical protein